VSISRCSRTYKDTSSAAHGTMMWRQIFWRMKTSFVATPTCHIYSFPPFGIQRTLPTLQWHQDLLIECWTATGLVLCEIVMHRYVPFILACMHFHFLKFASTWTNPWPIWGPNVLLSSPNAKSPSPHGMFRQWSSQKQKTVSILSSLLCHCQRIVVGAQLSTPLSCVLTKCGCFTAVV
jgi:hypothetical protein